MVNKPRTCSIEKPRSRARADFAWAEEIYIRSEAENSYNVAPGSYRPVMHVDGDALFVDDMHWGYRSSWAEASGKIRSPSIRGWKRSATATGAPF
jgi:putative SOS response-associated peptidase YedK